jgi:hypothetical protein
MFVALRHQSRSSSVGAECCLTFRSYGAWSKKRTVLTTNISPLTGLLYSFYGFPKRERYSPDVIKALTISAARKSPPNWLSFVSQKL